MHASLDYLISAQHESGGWGYTTESKPVVEPTAVALLALQNETDAETPFEKGMSWLLRSQNSDGGWGINENDPESGWQTAWAVLALRKAKQDSDTISRAMDWLTYVGTNQVSREEFKKYDIPVSDDPGAIVWPWLPDQVCWIEPTAMAILGLESKDNSPLASSRIKAAVEYFIKYRTPIGGWDIGNAGLLDTIVLPRAYPTSLVLMALNLVAPQVIINNDISALKRDMMFDQSVLLLSSGLLAIRSLGENPDEVETYIKDKQYPNGSWDNNPFFTGWAMMAIRGYM
jgi:Squalene-hopene cyclase N-terminal domain